MCGCFCRHRLSPISHGISSRSLQGPLPTSHQVEPKQSQGLVPSKRALSGARLGVGAILCFELTAGAWPGCSSCQRRSGLLRSFVDATSYETSIPANKQAEPVLKLQEIILGARNPDSWSPELLSPGQKHNRNHGMCPSKG